MGFYFLLVLCWCCINRWQFLTLEKFWCHSDLILGGFWWHIFNIVVMIYVFWYSIDIALKSNWNLQFLLFLCKYQLLGKKILCCGCDLAKYISLMLGMNSVIILKLVLWLVWVVSILHFRIFFKCSIEHLDILLSVCHKMNYILLYINTQDSSNVWIHYFLCSIKLMRLMHMCTHRLQ